MFKKKDDTLQNIMIEYFKQDSKRPDFMESLIKKLNNTENRKNPQYMLQILGIISKIDDSELKLKLLSKLVEEIVLYINGGDYDNQCNNE